MYSRVSGAIVPQFFAAAAIRRCFGRTLRVATRYRTFVATCDTHSRPKVIVGIAGLTPNSDFGLWGRSGIGKLAKLCKSDNFANIATLWILSETRMLQALVAPRPNSQAERRFERM
jgi:hypothetical protein